MPVVCVAPQDRLYAKVLSNMQEVMARGGRVIAITSEGNGEVPGLRRLAHNAAGLTRARRGATLWCSAP